MKKVAQGAKWTWSALRPGAVIGWSLVSPIATGHISLKMLHTCTWHQWLCAFLMPATASFGKH